MLELPAEQLSRTSKHNRAARVVSGWLQDADFLDAEQRPLALEYGDADRGFNRLVKRYSGDVPARAVLDELVRVGTVSKQPDDTYLLKRIGYVPHDSQEDMLLLFGDSAADLLETLDHNLTNTDAPARLQLSVVYDNLSQESLEAFRNLSQTKAAELLKELDRHLASQDRDIHPDLRGTGRFRVGLGVYQIENVFTDHEAGHES